MDTATRIFDAMELFSKFFAFKIGQSLRHKADKKEYGSNDMGLLVIERYLCESQDSENSLTYKRKYVCRMVRFSGSGDMAIFDEHELQTIEDWRKDAVNDEVERNILKSRINQLEADILGQFGISKQDRFYLKDSTGLVNKEKEFRMTGFKANAGQYEIQVRQSNTLDVNAETHHIRSKDQIVKIE